MAEAPEGADEIVVGGAGTSLQPEDVASVAGGSPARLDPTVEAQEVASARKGKRGIAPSIASQENQNLSPPPDSELTLPREHARAVAFAKLSELALANCRPRTAVLQRLASLLSASSPSDLILPAAAPECMRALASCVCYVSGGLTPAEINALEQGQSAVVGLGSLGVTRASVLLQLAETVGALSCESLCASASAFDASRAEDRPHKSEVQAALELSALLESSQRTSSSGKGKRQSNSHQSGTIREIASMPQVYGQGRDALSDARASLRVELNSGSGGEVPEAGSLPFAPSRTVATSLSSLAQAVIAICGSSQRRCLKVLELTEAPSDLEAEIVSSRDALARAKDFVRSAISQLAGEDVDAEGETDLAPARLEVARALLEALRALQRSLATETRAACLVIDRPNEAMTSSVFHCSGLGRGTATFKDWIDAALYEGGQSEALHTGALVALFDPHTSSSLKSTLDRLKAIVEASAGRRTPKLPKGTRDFWPEQMAIRERAFRIIKEVFKRHGAVELDTPVFELRETLMGKYGEDSKLIYDLADQGGELLSLRFDLTVPFARYLAMHNVGNIKRYHIAKVYRRDNPQMSKGRFREFYQCDFDIAGSYGPMVADSEVIQVFVEVLRELDIGAFKVKVNDRRLLDCALEIAGVPQRKFRAICSSIDKLDKQPWSVVREEIVSDKGLPEDTADRVYDFVMLNGKPMELLAMLKDDGSPFGEHTSAREVLEELGTLFGYLEKMGSIDNVTFDLSMARGLDYYTGIIYEAVLMEENRVGSVGGGGRYDNLVGMFSNNNIPAVGASVGIERVFNILEEQERERREASGGKTRATATDVQVVTAPGASLEDRMQLCSELWGAGIRAEYTYHTGSKPQKQLSHANEEGIPLAVIIGGNDKEHNVVQVKDMASQQQEEVERAQLVADLQARIAKLERKV